MTERPDTDALFKALADPSRRKLLDLLHAHDGQTLNALCEELDMTRQGVTQHLWVLEAASTRCRCRRSTSAGSPNSKSRASRRFPT